MNLTLDDMREILEVYGEVPKAPKGYEFTGELRSPVLEEVWLGARGLVGKGEWLPRLILRKLPEVHTVTLSTTDIYPKGYEIPEGYEFAAFTLTKNANSLGATHAIDWYGNLADASDFYPDVLRILLKKKA